MKVNIDFSQPRKQPVQAVILALLKAITSVLKTIWPFLLAYVFSTRRQENDKGNGVWLVITLGIAGFTIVYNLLGFFFHRYLIRNNELIIKKGFFIKKETVIPFQKIQAVHLERDWLQRLLNIARVSFDTPGAKHTEETIFLEFPVATALRKEVIGNKLSHTVSETSDEAPVPVITLSAKDLFKLGISANFMKALIVLLAFVFSRLDDISGITGKSSWDWVEWVETKTAGGSVALIASGIISLLILSVIISFVLVLLKYGNFSLSQSAKGFHIRSGLINVREKLVPFKKVQLISWEANWIRRYIPYYLCHFHIIGDHEISEKWRIAVPVTRLSFFPILLHHYHPQLPKSTEGLFMSKAYFVRQVLYAAVAVGLCVLISWLLGWHQAYWLGLVFPVWILRAGFHRKNFSASISAEAIQVNHSIFSKSHILLRWDKVVSVSVKQSIFQRSRMLATVILYTGGGKMKLPYIKYSEACQVRDYALYKTEVLSKNKIAGNGFNDPAFG